MQPKTALVPKPAKAISEKSRSLEPIIRNHYTLSGQMVLNGSFQLDPLTKDLKSAIKIDNLSERLKSAHQSIDSIEFNPDNLQPELLKVVEIVNSVLQEPDKQSDCQFNPRTSKKLGFLRGLAARTVILAPAAAYIACGGGGEDDKESPTATFDNMPIPQREIDIDMLDERFEKREEEKRVYIDTFRPAKDRIQKLVLEIGSSFEPQVKTVYIPPPPKPQPAAEPQPSYQPPAEVKPGVGNKIILTFDDSGPQAWSILDILAQYGAKGIFFPNGSFAAGNPDLIQRMYNEGHLVCNHTRDHTDLTTLSYEGIRDQILGGAGVGTCNLLRPPYGAYNTFVASVAAEFGYSIYMWDIDTRDWATRYAGGDQVILNIVLSQAYPGAVVLMHMHVDNTVYALPAMLQGLKDAGYELHW